MLGSVEPLIVNDIGAPEAREFLEIPAVTEFHMRSYIGVPIVLHSGRVYGTLCALDIEPRQNTRRDLDCLVILARLIASQIDRQEMGILEERNRLAREIHDTIAQTLSALTLDLTFLGGDVRAEAPRLEAQVQALQELARTAARDVRRAIWNLHPAELEGRSLTEAIERSLHELDSAGISTTLEVRGQVQSLAPALEAALLRIAREALANVRKHSGASAVLVTLEHLPDEIVLRVDDNGRGLPEQLSGTGGFGLTSMRERARAAGGELAVRPRPSGGTSVVCIVPRAAGGGAAPDAGRTTDADAHRHERPRQAVRVVVVDDHAVVREGLRRLVEQSGRMQVVGEAADVGSAVAAVERHQPDVVLLDVRIPGGDGLAVLDQLRRISPDTRAIMLTTYAQDEIVYQAVQRGARGYLLKDAAASELVGAITAVAAGRTAFPDAVVGRLAERVHRADALTARELDVLTLMAEGLRNKEIAARLGTSDKTVEFHSSNIFGKLAVQNRTEAVRVARLRGLLASDI